MVKKYADVVKPLLSIQEEICFNLFSLIFEDRDAFVKTDMKNYIIAQVNEQTTIWIWVSPQLEDTSIVVRELVSRILINPKVHINTTSEYGERILQLAVGQIGTRYAVCMPMNVYACYNLKCISCIGRIVMPCERHKDQIKNMTKQIMAEAKGINLDDDVADEFVIDMIYSGKLFLWENEEKEIVSMARIDHEASYGRINKVVTDLKYRGKGYAGMLVSEMCRMLMGRGVTPIVYADSRNPSSNKMYQKIGFEVQGNITEYMISDK